MKKGDLVIIYQQMLSAAGVTDDILDRIEHNSEWGINESRDS